MDVIWSAILYTLLGFATLAVGIVKLFLFAIAAGLFVIAFGLYWSYKSAKKEGELKGW